MMWWWDSPMSRYRLAVLASSQAAQSSLTVVVCAINYGPCLWAWCLVSEWQGVTLILAGVKAIWTVWLKYTLFQAWSSCLYRSDGTSKSHTYQNSYQGKRGIVLWISVGCSIEFDKQKAGCVNGMKIGIINLQTAALLGIVNHCSAEGHHLSPSPNFRQGM